MENNELSLKRRNMENKTINNKNHKCVVATVANHKGGCEKSTTTGAFANYLFEDGYSVLAVDTDPQGDLGKSFGVETDSIMHRKSALSNIYRNLDSMTPEIFNSPVCVRGSVDDLNKPIIALLTGDIRLVPAAEYAKQVHEDNCEVLFNNVIETYKKYFDYILFDTTPHIANSICGKHALTLSDCIVIPVDALESAEGVGETLRVAQQKCKKDVKIIFSITKYKVDDKDLTAYFEAGCLKNNLPCCDAPVTSKSTKHIKGYDERRSTIYRCLKKVFPNNICITAIPEEQLIGNNSYTSLNKKYKLLYEDMCLEIKRKIKSDSVEMLLNPGVIDKKIVELNRYMEIVRDYKTQNTSKDTSMVAFMQ